ncbi:metal-dependent hydrolase [Actinomadura scrupuli]|uniref:metal-dependent hydrolase n=1 Tax=Actinomadura scrupuli TaxID=559629 RepID=UPI003D97DA31
MMGHTHALTGAAAWLAVVPLVTNHGLLGDHAVALSPAQMAAGALVCAGAALLPDIDHHDGGIANTYGFLTRWLCLAIGKISGGHRHATHSLAFAFGAGWATDVMATHAFNPHYGGQPLPGVVAAWWVMLFLVVGLGLRGVGIGFKDSDHLTGLLNAVLAAGLVYVMRHLDMRFVGYAVTLGCLAHVAGDCLTPRGCPVFWPAQWRIGFPVVPRTNGTVERWVVTPALTLCVVVLAVRSALGDTAVDWLKS